MGKQRRMLKAAVGDTGYRQQLWMRGLGRIGRLRPSRVVLEFVSLPEEQSMCTMWMWRCVGYLHLQEELSLPIVKEVL